MNQLRLFFLFTIILFTAAACSAAAGQPAGQPAAPENSVQLPPGVENVNFLPIEMIVDQELEVSNFASDGSATLPVQTSAPVACSVVYGKTPAFGSLTLDQDMAGGAHADHNPILTGLEPETTYYFRLQGVDEEGNVYISETMSFTTPPQESSETENLASPEKGAVITGYSSAYGDAAPDARWGVLAAFDDNPNTEWSSNGDGNDAWVEVALARRAAIDSVAFQTRSMSDGSATTLAFTITTDSGETLGPFELPDDGRMYEFDTAVTAKTLRFNLIDTTGGNTGAVDIAVYGSFIDE